MDTQASMLEDNSHAFVGLHNNLEVKKVSLVVSIDQALGFIYMNESIWMMYMPWYLISQFRISSPSTRALFQYFPNWNFKSFAFWLPNNVIVSKKMVSIFFFF